MYCGANGPVGFAVWADIVGKLLCVVGGGGLRAKERVDRRALDTYTTRCSRTSVVVETKCWSCLLTSRSSVNVSSLPASLSQTTFNSIPPPSDHETLSARASQPTFQSTFKHCTARTAHHFAVLTLKLDRKPTGFPSLQTSEPGNITRPHRYSFPALLGPSGRLPHCTAYLSLKHPRPSLPRWATSARTSST